MLLKDSGNDAAKSILNVLESLVVLNKTVGPVKKYNCKFTNRQILVLVILFPFYLVKDAYSYVKSDLGRVFKCGKDMFYRFMNDGRVDWRKIVYSIAKQLWRKIDRGTGCKERTFCLVIDDSDLPKRGRKFEFIGKVHSHVKMQSIIGMKALFLMLTNGKTQQMLDVSLHCERGKNPDKPQGLSKKHLGERYTKERGEDEKVQSRISALFESKITTAIRMVKMALLEGIRFKYLLVDSWFPCAELVKFIHGRHIDCHLLGMIKMGKTKYETELGELNAREIISKLAKKKEVRYRRGIGYYTATIPADFAGVKVKLFFYRKGKNGPWNALITTDLELMDTTAFYQYSWRWAIEVAHREMKGYLGLGKKECRDFAGQIAAVSICMIQYNILSYVKRFESYETLGGLFAEITKGTAKLSVIERIWNMILDVVNILAESLNKDPFELTELIVNNDEDVKKIQSAFAKLDYGGVQEAA